MLYGIDYTVIIAFLAVTVGVGLWFSRRWRGTEGFFLAGRSLTWPFIGLSLFATNISTEHFVGLAAGGHEDGLVQGGYEWIASYCLILLAVVFAPQYLRHRVFTIPEFFEKRYGIEARLGLSVYFLAMIVLTKTTVAVFGGAKVISHFTDWDLYAVMWGIGIITALYTMIGGLSAVIYTDFIQALVLIGGSVVLTFAALGEVGGWDGLTERLADSERSHMLSMVRPPTDENLPFSGFLLGNLLIGGLFYWCMDQVNVQRVLGARSIAHARAGALFAGFLKIIPVFILVLPGVIAAVLWDDIPKHNDTYAVLVERLLAPGLRGLVLAALLAALMSSLSSAFNSAATLVSRDLFARFRPDMPVSTQIRIGQAALVMVMAAGVTLASTGIVESYSNLWNYLQEVTAYLSVPFAVAGLLGVTTRRINREGAFAGVLAGVGAGIFLLVDSKNWHLLDHPLLASFLHRTFVAGVIAALTMALVSALTPPPPEEVKAGSFYVFRRRGRTLEERPATLLADHRLWAGILLGMVTALWWTFA